MDFTEVNF
jgi:hypothetical protein